MSTSFQNNITFKTQNPMCTDRYISGHKICKPYRPFTSKCGVSLRMQLLETLRIVQVCYPVDMKGNAEALVPGIELA